MVAGRHKGSHPLVVAEAPQPPAIRPRTASTIDGCNNTWYFSLITLEMSISNLFIYFEADEFKEAEEHGRQMAKEDGYRMLRPRT